MARDHQDVPTLVSNKFICMTGKQNISLVFGEAPMLDGPVFFHQAVMLSHADARWLADLINAEILKIESIGEK